MPEIIHSRFRNWVSRLTAIQRLLFCLGLAVICFIIFFLNETGIITSAMIGWDIFSFLMITFCWSTFFTTTPEETCVLASREDESRTIIFTIVLVSVLISLFAIIILMKNTNEQYITKGLHEPVSLLGVALSWFLLHSIFTLHYTHLYYGDNKTKGDEKIGGLNFPEEEEPDYLDFAYFAFVIGMTFQVSDINITARNIRRLALLHGIVSFLFNTIIVALTISIITNLKT